MNDVNKNINVKSFVFATGTVFLKFSHHGEVIGGGFFPCNFIKSFTDHSK
jgi:hypothetical protein